MKSIHVLALSLLLFGCVHTPQRNEANINALVQGTWAEYVQDGEIKVYVTYLPDGRFHTFGYFPPDFKRYFFADGFWKIRGNSSCIFILYISTDDFAPGDELCNRIVRINEREFVFDSDGENIKMLKVRDVKL